MTSSLAEIKVRDPAQWYKANTDFYGYYRVNYDVENWRALCRQLDEDHTVSEERGVTVGVAWVWQEERLLGVCCMKISYKIDINY